MKWTYTGGELCENSAMRTHKSDCGRYGKVTRTRGSPELGYGKGKVKYFLWADPDREYATLAECQTNTSGRAT